MKIRYLLPTFLIVLLAFLFTSTHHIQAASHQGATAAAAHGVVRIGGEEVIVTIWAKINPGEDAHAAAEAVLRRAYPDARPLDHSNYVTTGLVWDQFGDGNPGNDYVTVHYNPADAPSYLDSSALRDTWWESQRVWNDVTSSAFAFADGGDTNRCPSLVRECPGRQTFDGNNDVGWGDIRDQGVLGVTWYGTGTDEMDMYLDNTDYTWYVGLESGIGSTMFDAWTVWMHEFGHGLGLGHSDIEGAIMEPYYEGIRRQLHQDDVDGISALYPAGDVSPTPTPSPTASPTPTPSPTDSPEPTPTDSPTPTPEPGEVLSVPMISYWTEGGKNSDKHLYTQISVVGQENNPIEGALVSVTIDNADTGQSWTGSASTNSSGDVVFSLKNAPSGTYITTVDAVELSGSSWDGVTPNNSFQK